MRLLLLLALGYCAGAHADIYRWIDPETGSVRISNAPPPWYEGNRAGPPVEHIPAPALPAPAPSRTSPAANRAAPSTPPAKPGAVPPRLEPQRP